MAPVNRNEESLRRSKAQDHHRSRPRDRDLYSKRSRSRDTMDEPRPKTKRKDSSPSPRPTTPGSPKSNADTLSTPPTASLSDYEEAAEREAGIQKVKKKEETRSDGGSLEALLSTLGREKVEELLRKCLPTSAPEPRSEDKPGKEKDQEYVVLEETPKSPPSQQPKEKTAASSKEKPRKETAKAASNRDSKPKPASKKDSPKATRTPVQAPATALPNIVKLLLPAPKPADQPKTKKMEPVKPSQGPPKKDTPAGEAKLATSTPQPAHKTATPATPKKPAAPPAAKTPETAAPTAPQLSPPPTPHQPHTQLPPAVQSVGPQPIQVDLTLEDDHSPPLQPAPVLAATEGGVTGTNALPLGARRRAAQPRPNTSQVPMQQPMESPNWILMGHMRTTAMGNHEFQPCFYYLDYYA